MLRAARVRPVFLALAAWACSGSGEAPTGDPDQPAGKVIELAGQVSAAREGAAARPLAAGAPVFADDTVTTGADGSAVILLAHNQVRWSLGSGTSLRVDRSLAWKATGDQGGSAFDDEDPMATASAGRHTDREAGDTAATAQLPPASSEPAAEPAPAAPDTVARAEAAPKRSEPRAAPRRKAPAPPPRDDRMAGRSGAGGGGPLEIGGAAAAAPTSPAPAPAPPAPPPAGNLIAGKLTVKGALAAGEVASRLGPLGRACRGTVAGKVVVRFEIDPTGAVKNVRLRGPSAAVAAISACVSADARALRFPASGGATTVEREIQIAPATGGSSR